MRRGFLSSVARDGRVVRPCRRKEGRMRHCVFVLVLAGVLSLGVSASAERPLELWHFELVPVQGERLDGSVPNDCSTWHELWPTYCIMHHQDSYEDDGDGLISPCDYFTLDGVRYHIDWVGRRIISSPLRVLRTRLLPNRSMSRAVETRPASTGIGSTRPTSIALSLTSTGGRTAASLECWTCVTTSSSMAVGGTSRT